MADNKEQSEKKKSVEAFDINQSDRKEDTKDDSPSDEVKGNAFRVNETAEKDADD